jgi:hypothetical protein
MSATTTVPFTVTPEAAERIAELGMQREFDLMIEHTRQTVPYLRSITVTLEDRYELGDEPVLVIESTVDHPQPLEDPSETHWGGWKVDTFQPDVCRHFIMCVVHGTTHEG